MTNLALEAGYMIGYVHYQTPADFAALDNLLEVTENINLDWCIDPDRVFYTGHSEGGAWVETLLADDDVGVWPRGGAASASNHTGEGFQAWGCPPEPRAIMVTHSADDRFYPPSEGYGLDVALLWATCNECTGGPEPGAPCMEFTGCAAETLYCETTGTHLEWTGMSPEIIEFFDRASEEME